MNIDLNAEDNKGLTPLHYAAIHGSFCVVQYLLEVNANIDAKDLDGLTPLHHARLNSNYDVAEYLIQKGATTI